MPLPGGLLPGTTRKQAPQGPGLTARTSCAKTAVLFLSLAACTAVSAPAAAELSGSLHGTLWKICSWATNDEYVGFHAGDVYYVVLGGYSSVDLLTDGFYRDYDRCSIGCGAVPERLINYAGDVIVWGLFFHRPPAGIGFSLPLPVPALLVLRSDSWHPDG